MRSSARGIDSSVCDLEAVIGSIKSSSDTQEEKIEKLEELRDEIEEFIDDVVEIDEDAAEAINQSKEDFYDEYYYLKPECEKSTWEKFKDGLKKVGEWCKEHWKLIVTIVIVVAAIVCLFVPGVNAAIAGLVFGKIILGAAAGALMGAISGGLLGGVMSALTGGSFFEGFEDGAFSGALTGALMGGLGGAGEILGQSIKCVSTLGKAVKITAKVSAVLSGGMGLFDMSAMVIGMFDPNNAFVRFNQRLHESKLYNGFQFGVDALAALTGGMTKTMKCFVAGTMIATASGLVAIENIRVGDRVMATDPETGITAEKSVLETYIREATKLIHIVVNGDEIITTETHPFFVKGRGFVDAEELIEGDELQDINGKVAVIEHIEIEETEPTKVYNFQVEDFHTYHVGENGILVHNANNYDQAVLQLDINKENGKKFNQQLENIAKENPNTELVATEVPMNVEGGKQYRADLIIKKKNGEMIYIEGKASSTAPHTHNQKIDFANNGNKLIGDAKFTKKGLGIFGSSTGPSKGTTIYTIRPDNIQDLINLLNKK
ncbi:polymorphic toxin-type HINT domain-containing protein [Ruminococcus flavefaciens]|uniref:polymorphic toxin-type HINT domain-containing protein n=1 Tax=Ruminococcus flavefaciens TaxID=1265 RepID=UPI0002D7D443|nr:polymorphic toxin-type HINT domain-containing protein [Ruminococcus flavefaciens]